MKRHTGEDELKLPREIKDRLAGDSDVASACRGVETSDATYQNWRKRHGKFVFCYDWLTSAVTLDYPDYRLIFAPYQFR